MTYLQLLLHCRHVKWLEVNALHVLPQMNKLTFNGEFVLLTVQ